MTVQELIDELNKVENKDAKVVARNLDGWISYDVVIEVSDELVGVVAD